MCPKIKVQSGWGGIRSHWRSLLPSSQSSNLFILAKKTSIFFYEAPIYIFIPKNPPHFFSRCSNLFNLNTKQNSFSKLQSFYLQNNPPIFLLLKVPTCLSPGWSQSISHMFCLPAFLLIKCLQDAIFWFRKWVFLRIVPIFASPKMGLVMHK